MGNVAFFGNHQQAGPPEQTFRKPVSGQQPHQQQQPQQQQKTQKDLPLAVAQPKQVTPELRATLDSRRSRDGPDFMAEAGFRGVRLAKIAQGNVAGNSEHPKSQSIFLPIFLPTAIEKYFGACCSKLLSLHDDIP